MSKALILCALIAAGPVTDDEPDRLVLRDGKQVECRVLYEGQDTIIARSRRKNREYAMAEVSEVHSIERSMRMFLDQFAKLPDGDVAGLTDLAAFCESSELHAEARNLWIRIVLLSPEDERAWTKLGGTKGRKGWRLKVRGRFYTLDQLRERVSDWKNAMEIPTAHFLIKTDIDPERALDLSIDLERAYQAFYDLLGPHLELFVFDERPEVHIYSDADDYPTPPTPRDAWFSRAANQVYVNGSEDRDPSSIVHNLTYALIHNAFRRTLGKTGVIQPWCREGLAHAFGGGVRPDPGRTSWDTSQPIMAHFRPHATAEEPLSLKEVLRAGYTAFDSGRKASLYNAQSYTLCHFLANAGNRKYRPAFGEYLRDSYLGKGSTSSFEKIMGKDIEELEPEWKAYVKEMVGQ